jgi:NAD-dependent deacetylase
MEKAGKLDGIITQNIDGLHQRAGSKNVQEVHGTTFRNYCMKCHEKYPYDFIFKSEGPIPKCPKCGGMVRPDVTLYGEGLPQAAWIESKRLVFRADCLIIGGTSLAVQPAASLAYDFMGKYLVIINRDKTFADRNAHLVFHDNITEVLDSIILED